eukprot:353130-Chlamydomonas_euryale.AAC.4
MSPTSALFSAPPVLYTSALVARPHDGYVNLHTPATVLKIFKRASRACLCCAPAQGRRSPAA